MLVATAGNILNARQSNRQAAHLFVCKALTRSIAHEKSSVYSPSVICQPWKTDHWELLLRAARYVQLSNSCLLKAKLCMLPGKPHTACSAQTCFIVICTCSPCTYVGLYVGYVQSRGIDRSH